MLRYLVWTTILRRTVQYFYFLYDYLNMITSRGTAGSRETKSLTPAKDQINQITLFFFDSSDTYVISSVHSIFTAVAPSKMDTEVEWDGVVLWKMHL